MLGARRSDSDGPARDGLQAQRSLCFCARLFGKVLANEFECIPVRRDFEKRIPKDSHVAINPFPVVQLSVVHFNPGVLR
jgi:hypothetical protein